MEADNAQITSRLVLYTLERKPQVELMSDFSSRQVTTAKRGLCAQIPSLPTYLFLATMCHTRCGVQGGRKAI